MKIKSLVQRLLILSFPFLFLFFIIELFFRLFYPHNGYSITYASWGWTHMPNTKVTFYDENPRLKFNIFKRPHPIPIRYNSKGLREFEYDYKKPDNVFRILILGDSYAEDMGSFFENLHAKWLERKLNKMDYPYKIEVINAGYYAFDNAQELMFYLKEGKKYSPNIVIVMYNNDTADSGYATLGGDGKLILHYKNFTLSHKLYRNIVSLIRRHTHFGSFLLDRLNKFKKLKDFLIGRGYKEKDKLIPEYLGLEGEPEFTQVDKAIWLSFKKEAEKSGGIFIFMNCSQHPQISPEGKTSNRKFLIDNKILLFGNKTTKEEADWLKEREIKAGIYNRFYDSHRAGYRANEKVADNIIDFLLSNKLLPDKLQFLSK